MNFTSVSEEIRYHAKDFMSDGAQYPLKVIKEYVKSKMSSGFSEGAFAGAMRDLVAKEAEYEVIRRGVYQYVGAGGLTEEHLDIHQNLDDTDSLLSIPVRYLSEAIENIKEDTNNRCNILDMSDDELDQVELIRSILEQVQKIVEGLEER